METVQVTIVDDALPDARKRELAARLTGALAPEATELTNRARWRVVAEAVRPAAASVRGTDRRPAVLDQAAWHAHLAGTRRWVPGGDGRTA